MSGRVELLSPFTDGGYKHEPCPHDSIFADNCVTCLRRMYSELHVTMEGDVRFINEVDRIATKHGFEPAERKGNVLAFLDLALGARKSAANDEVRRLRACLVVCRARVESIVGAFIHNSVPADPKDDDAITAKGRYSNGTVLRILKALGDYFDGAP